MFGALGQFALGQFEEQAPEITGYQGLSVPVRRAGLAVALIVASGAVISPWALTQAEAVSIDKWQRPLEEPVRVRPALPTGEHQVLAFVKASPFPETVSIDRWHLPLSEPVRIKRGLADEQQQSSAFVAPVLTDATWWLSPLSEPVRIKRGLADEQQQTLAFVKATPFPETVSVDRWLYQLSEPVRPKRGLADEQQQVLAFVKASPFPETVSADRWLQPLSQPYPAKRALLPGAQEDCFLGTPPVAFDGRYQPFSEPVRIKRGLADEQQQALALVEAAPFAETVSIDRWARPLNEPVRVRPALGAALQRSAAFDPYPIPPSAEVVTVDKWFKSYAEPTRIKGLPTAEQQALAFVKAAPFAEAVSVDRWQMSLSEPVRVRPTGRALPATALVFDTLSFAWFQPLSLAAVNTKVPLAVTVSWGAPPPGVLSAELPHNLPFMATMGQLKAF